MDGLIIVNKPYGLSSQQVDTIIKRTLNCNKCGHLGTLDPLATGVLVVFINNATKLASFMEEDIKQYKIKIVFGYTTTTFDLEGEITNQRSVGDLDVIKIDQALQQLIGDSLQTPPIYSAIKINGKKLYQYALKDEEVELPKRRIHIYELRRISELYYENNELMVDVIATVSKGTYIRSLVQDFGQIIGELTCMAGLIRTASGNFKLADSYSLEDIKNGNYQLIKMSDAISLPKVVLDQNPLLLNKILHGMRISLHCIDCTDDKIAFIYQDNLIAIYQKFENERSGYAPLRVWN